MSLPEVDFHQDEGYSWVVLVTCFLLQFLTAGGYTSIGGFMVEYYNHFQPNKTTLAWVGTLFLASSTILGELKLPSVLAVWLFWTFHNKSHNMKALAILSHSCSPFLPLTYLYGNNELLWVYVQPSGVFSQEKTPPRLPMQITWPWPPMGRFSHGLITIRQTKMWT